MLIKFKKSEIRRVSSILLICFFLMITISYSKDAPVILNDDIEYQIELWDGSIKTKYGDGWEIIDEIDGSKLKRLGKRIIKEDSVKKIDWELESHGCSPITNKCYLEGVIETSGQLDIGVISPVEFKSGTKAYIWKDETSLVSISNEYTCDSKSFGFLDKNTFYCDTTKMLYENGIFHNRSYQETIILTNQNNVEGNTIYWNTTRVVTEKKKIDISSSLKLKKDWNTDYGDKIYYDSFNFEQGKKYPIRLEIEVNPSDLPIKYTVVIGDIEQGRLDLILDPTITDSRTWTVQEDFDNETVVTNLTTTNNDIRLSNWLDFTPTLCWNMDVDSSGQYEENCDGTGEFNVTVIESDYTASGRISGGRDFEKGNGDVDEATSTRYNLSGNMVAFGAWVKLETLPPAGVANAWILSTTSGGNTFFTGGFSDGNAYPRCFYSGGSLVDDNVGAVTGEWIHVVCSYDGQRVRLWVNGSLEASATGVKDLTDELGLYIGAIDQADASKLDGVIDNLFVHVGNISNQDVLDIYNSQKSIKGGIQDIGEYHDLYGWCPQAGNQITNISFEYTTTGTDGTNLCYGTDNSTFSTCSALTTNGTNNVDLSLGADNCLYYKLFMNDTTSSDTPKITSYTIYENAPDEVVASTVCDVPSTDWTINETCKINDTTLSFGYNLRIVTGGTLWLDNTVLDFNGSGQYFWVDSGGTYRADNGGGFKS